MCIGSVSGYNPEKERVPKSCPFTEGIRECKEASCYHNILGGCFKKGSGYNENGEHKDFNYFERMKLMNINEFARQLTIFEFNTIYQWCKHNGDPIENDVFMQVFDERVAAWKELLLNEYEPEGGDNDDN